MGWKSISSFVITSYSIHYTKLYDSNYSGGFSGSYSGNNNAYSGSNSGGHSGNNSGGYSGNNSGSTTSGYTTQEGQQVRMHIQRGDLNGAEQLLNRFKMKNAEWYYLKGLIFMRRGWHDEAYTNLQNAVNMEPANYEYKQTLSQMNNSFRGFRNASYNRGYKQDPDWSYNFV